MVRWYNNNNNNNNNNNHNNKNNIQLYNMSLVVSSLLGPRVMRDPPAICSACVNLFFFFFTKFSPYGRYLIVDYRFYPLFDGSAVVGIATNFMVKIDKNRTIHLYSQQLHLERTCNIAFWFQKFICDDRAILCLNLVNFDPVNREFKKVKGVHPFASLFKTSSSAVADEPARRAASQQTEKF